MLKEIVSFHIVLALFFGMLGFISFSLLVENNVLEIEVLINDYGQVVAEKAGVLMIFINNFSFFSLMCILPILNVIYVIVQFFNLGTYTFQIKDLDLIQQFTLLYRHSIFEVAALIIAIYISYSLLQMSNIYLNGRISDFSYKNTFKRIAILYGVIFILTMIGAILEGNVNVLI